MVTNNHYRWDFIGLSTDTKPTPATSEKVVNGSTYYCSDNSKLYVWYKDQWYEKTVSGGGSSYTAGDGIDITNDIISATNTGKARVLTTADYNANSNNWNDTNPENFNCIALWRLPSGMYVGEGNLNARAVRNKNDFLVGSTIAFVKQEVDNNDRGMVAIFNGSDNVTTTNALFYSIYNDGYSYSQTPFPTKLQNNLTTSGANFALDARQGKVLKDLIDSIAIRGAGAPTTSTAGSVGTLYEDTTNGDLYICTDATNPYVWEEVGGSSISPVQTTGTSTTDVMSQNAVTGMVFADPGTNSRVRIGTGASVGSAASGSPVAIGKNASAATDAIAIGGATASSQYTTAIGPTSTTASGTAALALGYGAKANYARSIAMPGATTSAVGEFNIMVGNSSATSGYNSSAYRLLTGLYDPQNAHDAANKEYVDNLAISYATLNGTTAPTTATAGKYVGQLYYDTTNEAMYFLKTIDTTTEPATYTWEALGGGSITPVQTTGTSTTDVMSQNAVTGMVFADPGTKYKPQIGAYADAKGSYSVAIGAGAKTTLAGASGIAVGGQGSSNMHTTVSGEGGIAIGTSNTASGNYSIALGGYNVTASGYGGISIGKDSSASTDDSIAIGLNAKTSTAADTIAIGCNSSATGRGSIALGRGASATAQGEINVSTNFENYGYNSSLYRLISGVYDGQSAHDAATKGQLDATESYSTTEVATGGTWVDGKAIYKKTISFGALPDSSTKTVAHGITNLYRVIKFEGMGYRSTDGHNFPIPLAFGGNDTIMPFVDSTDISIQTGAGRSSIDEVYITLYYTKSS